MFPLCPVESFSWQQVVWVLTGNLGKREPLPRNPRNHCLRSELEIPDQDHQVSEYRSSYHSHTLAYEEMESIYSPSRTDVKIISIPRPVCGTAWRLDF